MLKITISLLIIILPTWVYASDSTNSVVLDFQDQHILSNTIVIPGGSATISLNSQWQEGFGYSSIGSFATDLQIQGSDALDTHSETVAGGYTSNGTYSYFNTQASITLQVNSVSFGDAVGVGVIQGASTLATGDAYSAAGSYVVHGDFITSNMATSDTDPLAINTGGFIDIDPNFLGN
jgi:hypothetical protein